MSAPKVNTKCQSCGMPLSWKKGGDQRGTEANGEKSLLYCQYCYQDGAFTHPNQTIEEMVIWGKEGIKSSKEMGGFKKWILLKFYNKSFLKKFDRWKDTPK